MHTSNELRRLSGLTWEQLGQLSGVSRRIIQLWASGMPLDSASEERLMRVLDVVRLAYRGSAKATRAAILAVDTQSGTTPFDLLVAQRFDDAREVLGHGNGKPQPIPKKLSPEARKARTPLPPDVLVEGVSEQVGSDPGRVRVARSVRVRRGVRPVNGSGQDVIAD